MPIARGLEPTGAASWTLVRVVLGVQSVVTGAYTAARWDGSVAFNAMALGDGAAPLATAMGALFLVVGGACLVAGRAQGLGSALLLAFLLPATIRHFVVSQGIVVQTSPDAVAAMAQLATRGQLASLAKNVPLIAVAAALFMAARRTPAPAPSTQ